MTIGASSVIWLSISVARVGYHAANGTGVLSWYVDALFAVHPDMKGHTGGTMTMGMEFPLDKSTKHKLNTGSSMESEIVAVDDLIPQILWVHLFLKAQGFAVSNNIL